ncbi:MULTISPECIES: glycerophosphodiester phosphodiesterase family protein [unclassified Lentimicrobium]|uniref:glycerophosphodiester phosphodiesterase family protein n=1 Tax=unclassified Lentimicrobium TaxID=2677434 RepID=UPI00155702DD|nr:MULTISPECIES: glycerophosphodiester phosphodiesterase family protein [unclassified Lentimicrobium]NPD47582.1 glycerophosphodiester phosphodiesterase [Lentimicrobium sp. S6]NPD83614.1 glycerophosphodiester phosphodiesterase [Lentimicrobium sp. L6]
MRKNWFSYLALLLLFLIVGFVMSFVLSLVEEKYNSDSKEVKKIFIPKDIVIAHRGTTYWAPEETEMAYRWARDIGADYLEVDVQRTKDGVLLALHDDLLTRTTNIENIYPELSERPSSYFAFEELMSLDAGAWFYESASQVGTDYYSSEIYLKKTDKPAFYFNSEGEKVLFEGENIYVGGSQGVSTLEDAIRIAEGYRIAKDSLGNRIYEIIEEEGVIHYRFFYVKDEEDSGHRPGVYIEIKEPQLFQGIEEDLYQELSRLNWNVRTKSDSDTLVSREGKVNMGNTSAKVILQTFSPESLVKLNHIFKGSVPMTFLLWLGDDNMMKNDSITYFENLAFAKQNGAHIIGPSIAGPPNNYSDLLTEQNVEWIKSQGFLIHPYSFDTRLQMLQYGADSDGMFTNRTDLTIQYFEQTKNAKQKN